MPPGPGWRFWLYLVGGGDRISVSDRVSDSGSNQRPGQGQRSEAAAEVGRDAGMVTSGSFMRWWRNSY